MGNSEAKQQERRKHFEFPASHSPNNSHLSHDHTRYSNSIQVKPTNVSGAEDAQQKGEMNLEDNDIRAATSNIDPENDASTADGVYETKQEDNEYEMFTDFVNHSKFKIRMTSGIGSRNNISFKK
ncbi:hypothetical protein D8674_007395 [Pyrus ussuriensis x Pyrus communis]|uniref:Uncharacterized protein n=1 Tax=Pyrus ussuriensis x Pyrus communis TaxID=2448454 RepID=A0A5N5HPP0_9ROSA|nr:hypothetical protein D8674_007395 [Pyrus ussuriensis x Pyrus communis]